MRVRVAGGEHVPATGPARHRLEPRVRRRRAGRARRRGATRERPAAPRRRRARRCRSSAPSTRRLGAISSSGPDVAAALRAGHLVGIPLAPTWLRTGAGDAPLEVARALTLAPIVPAAVRAGRPLRRARSASWDVTFGPMVTLRDPYDPDDPLAAARFTEAMRRAVGALLDA